MSTVPIPQGAQVEPETQPIPQGAEIEGQEQPSGLSPEDEQSRTRQMLVSGLTGMPSPVMTEQEKQNFAKGKAAGAVSVPVVAAGTAGAEMLPEVLPHVVNAAQHPIVREILKAGVKKLGEGAVTGGLLYALKRYLD